ncbi:hypothetical protein KC343_g3635 [Hortaea werneckii]|uniref:GRF-type domain-containing protein n=1 Tax=Hortaea werneckii TaxID=91943 RepID=A0A3M7FTM4_HORWE|nr:hypothetical protein KC323_g8373 [Hortaea werneckii]KAI7262135.1 hypothetical protein KC352_g9811 [Hortaea werneckii]KAI7348826.1 hypothetical protein KC320_g6428 [Hortaea werneckii]KAI7562851.1 hypothetical protein KC317_g8136 [Hortaea werneckii]KAI7609485.1 hypothetical protein KC346_g9174 [Hortaea werneckii]
MFRGRGRGRGRGTTSSRGGRGRGISAVRPKGLFADGIWHCNCTPRLPAEHFKVKKEGKNQGRWFYTCQQQQEKRCDFFLWDEDAKPREEAAVLSGKRTEPRGVNAGGQTQDGWNAGRGYGQNEYGAVSNTEAISDNGGSKRQASAKPSSPPPPYSSPMDQVQKAGLKRGASSARMDDEDEEAFSWSLTAQEEQDLATVAARSAPETPNKAQKTGVYATPATSGKRKLPWEMPQQQPVTPSTAGTNGKPVIDYFQSPSKRPVAFSPISEEQEPVVETPYIAPTPTTAQTPTSARHHNALVNPADSASTLTAEALSALSAVRLPPDVLSNLRSILSKHDLKAQGVTRGRDISRLALKSKEAKIAELQKRIESLEADMELDRGVIRQLRWQIEHGQHED